MAARSRRAVSQRTIDRAKRTSMQRLGEQTRKAFHHTTDHWSSDQWRDLLAAARGKRLAVDLTLSAPRGPVRLMSKRQNGHALCVCASADYRALMAYLA